MGLGGTRLDELGLVVRRTGPADKRVREAEITPRGRVATDAVDEARERTALSLFAEWSASDLDELTRLIRRLADDMVAAGVR